MSGVNGIPNLFGTASGTSRTSSFSLSDYASIKNGSYGKLVKSYYRNEENEKAAATSERSSANLASVRAGADSLKSAADALSDPKLWEKKKIRTKNEESGEEEEKEDYDWDAITKAVNSFAMRITASSALPETLIPGMSCGMRAGWSGIRKRLQSSSKRSALRSGQTISLP